jgi:signal transduction histidine kinase
MNSAVASFLDMFRLPAFKTREQEESFRAWDDKRKLAFRAFFLGTAILTFSAVGLLDKHLGGDTAPLLFQIRALSVMVLLAIFGIFVTDCTPRRRETLIYLFGITVGISITIMTLVAPRPAADFYPFLISASMVFGHALVSPRFATMARLCLTANLIYWPTVVFSATSTPAIFANLFIMAVTSFAVVVGSLNREKLEREQMLYQARLADARRDAEASRDAAIRANLAKSHLLANVSHELRTPMNAILGFSELMMHEVFGSHTQPKYRDYAHDIHGAGTLLQTSINDLLDVSRLEVNKMSWTQAWNPLGHIIARAIKTCRVDTEAAGIELTQQLENDGTLMLCDPERMTQILVNLVNNATKFSQPGTTIEISTRATREHTILSVADQGCGIAANHIERICEPFGQIEGNSKITSKGGMGLGLSIVRGLVQKFEGRMEIESEIGKGTKVSLFIPSARIAERPLTSAHLDEAKLTLVAS